MCRYARHMITHIYCLIETQLSFNSHILSSRNIVIFQLTYIVKQKHRYISTHIYCLVETQLSFNSHILSSRNIVIFQSRDHFVRLVVFTCILCTQVKYDGITFCVSAPSLFHATDTDCYHHRHPSCVSDVVQHDLMQSLEKDNSGIAHSVSFMAKINEGKHAVVAKNRAQHHSAMLEREDQRRSGNRSTLGGI